MLDDIRFGTHKGYIGIYCNKCGAMLAATDWLTLTEVMATYIPHIVEHHGPGSMKTTDKVQP